VTEVKICGLTRSEDVVAACELGASILGFNFVAASPRRLTIARAREISAAAPATVLRAGVFATESRDEVARAVREVALQLVQLHRPVLEEDLEELGVDIVPAVPIEAGREGLPAAEILARCRAVLWDSSGGRGRAPDWAALGRAGALPMPTFVAGGLDPMNVGEVIRRLRPEGVDVASGVESAPGIKDLRKLERFFEAVREADRA
jgi:phosphoribosylanthranilate isomerase